MRKFRLIWEWTTAHLDLEVEPSWKEMNRLFRMYEQAHRAHHTLEHIDDGIQFLNRNYPGTYRLSLVKLAFFYHDAFYDVSSKENEKNSADLWRKYGEEQLFRNGQYVQRFPQDFVEIVYKLIMITASHILDPESSDLEKMMNDADMSILASDSDRYIRYAQDIAAEYRTVYSDEDYIKGRIGLFLSKIDTQRVFYTPEMAGNQQVKSNIELEWHMLRTSPEKIIGRKVESVS